MFSPWALKRRLDSLACGVAPRTTGARERGDKRPPGLPLACPLALLVREVE